MAEVSYPTAGGGGVTDVVYERLMSGMTGDGLVGTPTSPALCYADSSGRQVKIRKSRAAILRGFYYSSGPDELILPIAANASGKARIDKVVLRLDRNTFKINAKVRTGTPGSKPVAPAAVQQSSPDRFWELPIANIKVPSGASGIPSSYVTDIAYYIAEPALAGPAVARPAAAPGRVFFDLTNNRTYIGSKTSTWQTLFFDSKWQTVTVASGWKAGTPGLKVRRKSGWVSLQIDVYRTGATLSKTADTTLGTLSSAYRPEITVWGTVAITNPDRIAHVKVSPTGKISLEANNSQTIIKGAYAIGSLSYPMTE